MFRVLRTVKQIFKSARNIGKYSTQSKGYVEDAGEEFTFLKALPSQSGKTSMQDKFKDFNPELRNIAKTKSTQLLDSAEIRKLIYARFADEIVAKSKNVVENKNLESKDNTTREHEESSGTYSITDEFKMFKEQGYDFAVAKKSIENQNVKSLAERMKGLVVAGYMSSYSGELGLKEEVEKVMHKKALVIEEFMYRLTGELEEYSSELLG